MCPCPAHRSRRIPVCMQLPSKGLTSCTCCARCVHPSCLMRADRGAETHVLCAEAWRVGALQGTVTASQQASGTGKNVPVPSRRAPCHQHDALRGACSPPDHSLWLCLAAIRSAALTVHRLVAQWLPARRQTLDGVSSHPCTLQRLSEGLRQADSTASTSCRHASASPSETIVKVRSFVVRFIRHLCCRRQVDRSVSKRLTRQLTSWRQESSVLRFCCKSHEVCLSQNELLSKQILKSDCVAWSRPTHLGSLSTSA